MNTKKEVFGIELHNYLKATKEGKGIILDTLERQTSMHRKSIVRRFKREQVRIPGTIKKQGRTMYYTPDVRAALKELWDLLGEPCGELLHPVIEDTVAHLKKDGNWTHRDEVTEKLYAMSCATTKRMCTSFQRVQYPRKGISTTKPSKMKEVISVFCGPWGEVQPGVGQIDTVAHCGSTLRGDFVFSLGYTDIATMWTIYHG